MHVIALMNQKGGAGKTTIALGIAAYFHVFCEKKVLLVDCDTQQQSARLWADMAEDRYFEVIVIHPSELRKFLDKLHPEDYDYVIVDSPPRAEGVMGRIIACAHAVLIPSQPSNLDIWAVDELEEMISDRRALTAGVPGMPVGGLPHAVHCISRGEKGTRCLQEARDALAKRDFPLMKFMTTQYQPFKRTIPMGCTIYDYPEGAEQPQIQIKLIANEIVGMLHD